MPKQLSFWLGVGGVSLIAPVCFRLTAEHLGDRVPGLADLSAFITGSK